MQKINLAESFARIRDYWRPAIVAQLNGQEVKLVKFRGEFIWHAHPGEDEMFLCLRGKFRVELRDRVVHLGPGEMFVVPRGLEHRTAADEEVEVLVFEPIGTRNTGNVVHPALTAP